MAFTQPPTDIGTAIVAVLFEAVARVGECSVEGIDLAAQSGP